MLRFLTTRDHAYTLSALRADPGAPPVESVAYERLLGARRLPRAVYLFTDLDRLPSWELELAAVVYRRLARLGVPVLNDPARVKPRGALLRALHEAGLNDFNAYRLEEAILPQRYPVFLRRESGHGEPLTGLLHDRDSLDAAVETAVGQGVPVGSILIVEYAGEPTAAGVFRKLALQRVGERLVPQLCVHDEHWLVKYGVPGGATPGLYADEARILRDNPFAESVGEAFRIAGIEYGRADFGVVQGRVQVYEINTNPMLRPGGSHPSEQRMANQRSAWSQLLDALRDLDPGSLSGRPVRLRDERLRPYQSWRARLLGRRPVP
jgi:hypothetical protein